MYILDKKYHV